METYSISGCLRKQMQRAEAHVAHGNSFRLGKLALSTELPLVYGNFSCFRKLMLLAETSAVY